MCAVALVGMAMVAILSLLASLASGPPDPPPILFDPLPDAGATVSSSFYSAAMGETRGILVHLPRSYGLRQHASRRYPAIYLLHGNPGSPDTWDAFGAGHLADSLAAAGGHPEVILVYANGIGHQSSAPEWEDNPFGRDKVESQLLETVAHVDANFRTIADRRYRAIGGLSSGGFGAVNIASRHPDVFAVAMSFSGYFNAKPWVFRSISSYMNANSPSITVQSPAARTLHYIITSGTADPPYTYQTRAFATELTRLGIAVDAAYLPGGHDFTNWVDGLAFGLERIAREFQPPVPTRLGAFVQLSHPAGVLRRRSS